MRVLAGAVLSVLALVLAAAPASAQDQAAPVEGAEEASGNSGQGASEPGADGPVEVKVGALLNDIQQLDLQTHSYTVDIYIWFKWDDPAIDPSRTFEFLNPYELWGHIRQYGG